MDITGSDKTIPTVHSTTNECFSVDEDHTSSQKRPLSECGVDEEETQEGQDTKKKSRVWDCFTKIEGSNPAQAKCNYCSKELNCDPKKQGTSSLLYHSKHCKIYLASKTIKDSSQLKLFGAIKKEEDGGGSNLMVSRYNEKKIRVAIARMVIIDELSFRSVEAQGFRELMRTVEPRFPMPSRITVMRDCIQLYMTEKEQLHKMFSKTSKRVCLTTDTWTSVQNLNYMCITAHFIDKDWNLHKRIISFVKIPNHKGVTIGREIETCLLEWGIDSIFTVTVDNASSNDTALEYLKRRTMSRVDTILDNEFMHIRCCAHILNLIVTEGLKEVDDSIVRVRNAVKYVKSSPARLDKFKSCCERQKISYKGLLCLDVPTRWNSTFLMLDAAEKFQSAFELFQEDDGQFVLQLCEGLGTPTYDDWDNIRVFRLFLKIFYDTTLRISGSSYATSNLYFQELSSVYSHLHEHSKSKDYLVSSMANRMRIKYDKYWGDFDKINKLLFVAVVLDPRYKMDALEFWFNEIVGFEKANVLIANLRLVFDRLYQQYKKFNGGFGVGSSGGEGTLNETHDDVLGQGSMNFMSRYHQYRASRGNTDTKSEIERYLADDVELGTVNFDILNWWKVNSTKYPILGQIARDVLAIPISTVASESAFSTGGRVLDHFRSSLAPKTVEAIICLQNWLRSSSIAYDSYDVIEDAESHQLDSDIVSKNIVLDLDFNK